MNMDKHGWDFEELVGTIRHVHAEMAARAGKAVNLSLTLRNWLIGFYIAVYEQNGADRAEYGAQLLENLSSRLAEGGMDGVASRSLRQYRQFYSVYPEIWQTPSAKTIEHLIPTSIWQTLPAKSQTSPPIQKQPTIQVIELIQKLSFSHFAELIVISDETKRLFYEIECIRGNWSVRELKRQIASLYYERSGLSKDKKKLSELAQKGAEAAKPKLAIRDPYVFEFLGLKSREVMSESHLSASFCAPNATKRWWNMRWPVWTTAFSFPSTSLNCRRKRICSGLLRSRCGKRSHDGVYGIKEGYFQE